MFNEICEFFGGMIDDTVTLFEDMGNATIELVEGLGNDAVDGVDAVLGSGKHSDKDFLERAEYLLIPDFVKDNSFISHVFYDKVKPKKGSIVRCSLACDIADHTGIYIGKNKIVELNGNGKVRIVSYDKFLSTGSIRTGISIYVACDNNAIHLSSYLIADYAKSKVGEKRSYDSIHNNCHCFVAECIKQSSASLTLFSELESVISKKMNYNSGIKWRVWDK